MRQGSLVRTLAFVAALAAATVGGSAGVAATGSSGGSFKPANVDITQHVGNESEEAMAVNPTNPSNVVMVSNIDYRDASGAFIPGLSKGVSFDGGKTWATSLIATGGSDPLGAACCDASLSFDKYGNLFLGYLFISGNTVPIALSTDGGVTFSPLAQIAEPAEFTNEKTATFRFVDQPTITAGANEVWIVFNAGGPIVASGAPVTGLGVVGSFSATQVVPGTNNCTYGDVAIGPSGQVANVCTLTESGQGGGKIYVSVNPTGITANGPGTFGNSVFVAETHVGGFDFIPAQPDRSIDAEPGLAFDRDPSSPYFGRLYLIYTLEVKNESDNTDIELTHSDDNGATWSPALRVNDDNTVNSQFLPKVALDQTTGNLAIVWYDARNDLGQGGATDPNGIANDDAQFWGAFVTNGGTTISKNFQISAGTSNSQDAHNGIDFGDYTGLAFDAGVAHPAWADNSNSTGNNPDGALSHLDVYTASVPFSTH
jgi:hypothetical protein